MKRFVLLISVTVWLVSCQTTPALQPTATPAATATVTPIPPTPTPYDELATPDDKLRLEFFRSGGIWSFRISETETEWIIVIMAQKSALDDKPELQLGSATGFTSGAYEGAKKVLELFDADQKTWNAFVRLFADGVERGEFDAFLVKTAPIEGNGNVPISVAVTLTKDGFLEVVLK